jgi:methyl-accepting chemotaxis protein
MPTETKQETIKQAPAKQTPGLSTQMYLKISEIRDDTLVLKNGGVRSVLSISSINFNLKSEDEQNAIIYSYQGFINTIEFPIQIVIRSKKLDIDDYLDKLRKIGEKQTNPLLQRQTYEYVEYISKLVEYADIMQKEFFVVIPYDPYRSQKVSMLQKFFQNIQAKDTYETIRKRHEEFEQLKKGLNQRVSTVKSGLENCGLKVNQLTTKDLIELFYNIYNPTVARYEKAKQADQLKITTDEELAATEPKA